MQWLSIAGAAMVLAAYAAHQAGKLPRESLVYLTLNLVGAAILTAFAVRAREAGLALMEGAWTGISLVALAVRLRRPGAGSPESPSPETSRR